MSESAKNLANFKQYVHELSDRHLCDIAMGVRDIYINASADFELIAPNYREDRALLDYWGPGWEVLYSSFLIGRAGLDVPPADADLHEKYHEEGLDEAETQALAERERAAILGEVDAILISDTLHVLDDRLSSAP